MTSNAPTTDGETQSFTLSSPPLIRHTRASIGIVSQSQETTVSQSLNEHSPTTHFDLGHKVTRDTMVRKLTKVVTPAECECQTIACLSSLLFVKGAFDNTQNYDNNDDNDDDYEDSENTSEMDEEEGPEPARIQIDFSDVLVIDEEIVA